jgi:tape measure domain-containing protein
MSPTTIGTIQLIATIDTSSYKKDAREIEKTNSDIESSSEKTSSRGTNAFGTMAKVGLGAVITAAVAVGAAIVSNIGNAIKRVDTLNNSTRTFENMGFSADQVAKSMDALKKSILGLPTPLDAAVSGVQMIASSTNDLGKAQKIFSALNNGILGFGGNTEQVSGAIQQLSQDLAGGAITAETWNSLLDRGLGPTLNAIAKQMGKTSKELKAGLSDGSVSVETFTDALIQMNEKGGGGIQSLEKIAKDSTSGISTGFENMNTAITRGIASIIERIGSVEISGAISSIGTAFESALKFIGEGVTIAKFAIDTFLQALKPVFDFIGGNQQVMEVLKLSLIAIAAIIGVLAIAIGVTLVAAFALVVGAIQVAIFIVERIIEAVIAFGEGIANVITWLNEFSKTVGRVVGDIMNSFSALPGFFSRLWGGIVKLFSDVGTAIGNSIGNTFKSVINAVISRAVGIINGFIDSINNIVGVINRIPGVKIGSIGRLGVPQLAEGGIVSSATLAMIGEGSEPEAVIPLSKLDDMMNNTGGGSGITYNITIQASANMIRSEQDKRDFAKTIFEAFNQDRRAKSLPQIGVTQ